MSDHTLSLSLLNDTYFVSLYPMFVEGLKVRNINKWIFTISK